jgi:hypothetical protein
MIVKLDLLPGQFTALVTWLNDDEGNGWRSYFLAEHNPKTFQPKLVRLLKTRICEGNQQQVELEIPNFLVAMIEGDSIRLSHYGQEDRCKWLGNGKKHPRHLRQDGNNLFLIDPTPIVDSMFGRIMSAK